MVIIITLFLISANLLKKKNISPTFILWQIETPMSQLI